MSGDGQAAGIAEVATMLHRLGREPRPTTLAVDRERWAPFAAWCAARGLNSRPAVESTLLAYLREHGQWSWAHTKGVVTTVNRVHVRAGLSRPGGVQTARLLARVARSKGRVAESLVDALTGDELVSMCRALRGWPGGDDPAALSLSAAVLALITLGVDVPVSDVQLAAAVEGITVTRRETELLVTRGSRRVLLRESDDPFAYQVLRRAIGADAPLSPGPGRCATPGVSLDSAWRRAGYGRPPSLLPASWHDDDLQWFLSNLDRRLAIRLRDVAYLLVGVCWALRHEDISHLRIEDVRAEPLGYRIYVARSKTDPDGDRPPRHLPHVPAAGGRCHELCPACALAAHLRVLAARGREDGFLFGTYYAGRWRAMTRQNGRLRVLAAWEAIEPAAPQRRVASRSLRVTGATLAYQAGLSTQQIAQEVTLHASLEEAGRYIRRRRPAEFQLDY